MEKILLTGATGKIGSRVMPRLLQHAHRLRILVRDTTNAVHLGNAGTEIVGGNLLEPASLAHATDDIDTVIHLAATFRGATEDMAWATNLDGTAALARAAAQAGARRFIFASTSLVYGPHADRPAQEDDPVQPTRVYPASKAAAEQALLHLSKEYGFEICILRFAFVYGDGDPHIAEFLPMIAHWHPSKRLHMIHHADVTQALLRAITAERAHGIYNVADDQPMEVAALRQLQGLTADEDNVTPPLENPWESILNTKKVEYELGFQPLYPSLYVAQKAGAL